MLWRQTADADVAIALMALADTFQISADPMDDVFVNNARSLHSWRRRSCDHRESAVLGGAEQRERPERQREVSDVGRGRIEQTYAAVDGAAEEQPTTRISRCSAARTHLRQRCCFGRLQWWVQTATRQIGMRISLADDYAAVCTTVGEPAQ